MCNKLLGLSLLIIKNQWGNNDAKALTLWGSLSSHWNWLKGMKKFYPYEQGKHKRFTSVVFACTCSIQGFRILENKNFR